MRCFLSCFILSLVILFCCALATVVQDASGNNTTLHFKSLLKHWSYSRCDQMGLHYDVSSLLMDRLFISIGFTTSLISSLLSLTKVLLFHSVCKKNTSEAGKWALDCLCYTIWYTLDGWLAGRDPSLFPSWDAILLWFRFMAAEISHVH